MLRRTLFWTWIMFRFVFFVHPQSWIPYIYIGFRIFWYKNNLLWVFSSKFLFINQYNFLNLILSSSISFWSAFSIWALRQVSSKVFSYICIENFLQVNFNRHLVNSTICKIYMNRFRFVMFYSPSFCPVTHCIGNSAVCWLILRHFLWSPIISKCCYSYFFRFTFGYISLYSRNKIGPRTLSCSTPVDIFFKSESILLHILHESIYLQCRILGSGNTALISSVVVWTPSPDVILYQMLGLYLEKCLSRFFYFQVHLRLLLWFYNFFYGRVLFSKPKLMWGEFSFLYYWFKSFQ